jgi:hypothetical protein
MSPKFYATRPIGESPGLADVHQFHRMPYSRKQARYPPGRSVFSSWRRETSLSSHLTNGRSSIGPARRPAGDP